MGKFQFGSHGLPLAALALACNAAFAADINPELTPRAQRDGGVEALIVLPDQATPLLAPFDAKADYKAHRRALVDALHARAETQQTGVRDWLDARGIDYRPYWIANMLWARLSAADLAALATRNDVARVETNPEFATPLPQTTAAQPLPMPDAVEAIGPGVSKIGAPDVWAAGFNGQGVVIAGQDTGYQWDHPALKSHYRGWNGTAADHNYNWHDSIHTNGGANSCGVDSPAPCDDNSHGTHTAGTFVGGDGGTNQIGVAPGAKWIGCRNMDAGTGTPARYIECMQWLLAPTNLSGQNPNPDLAPDVVSNSWGCPTAAPPTGEGCTPSDILEGAVNNLVTGGIFFAAAAANDGPSCSTITAPPAIYDASFVVGATDNSDRMASFSSRGPVSGATKIRPDASAPGVSIRSSIPGGGYGSKSGTSMATPHVAGAAALLMSVNPALKGHPELVASLLRGTATTAGVADPYNTGCGGLTMANWPNYQVGYGRIDAWSAAVKTDTLFKDGLDETPPG